MKTKASSGTRLHQATVALINEARAWLVQQMWEHKELRPQGWDGKLSQDEALRLVLHHFGAAFGCPLNSDEREGE